MLTVPSFDQIVDAYQLSLLNEVADWSLEDGDIASTADGDVKVGDDAYNALFRLVQLWRYNEPHLLQIFSAAETMASRRIALNHQLNAIGDGRLEELSNDPFSKIDKFAQQFHGILDEQGAAVFGADTFSGSLMIAVSGALLRFKSDLAPAAFWKGSKFWEISGPLINNCSTGSIIVASANGYRHADEWAKTRPAKPIQKSSQDVISAALAGESRPDDEAGPGRCPEIVQLLSGGRFEMLAANIFNFAHDLAVKIRAARKPK